MHYQEDIADFLPQNKQSEKYSSVYNHLGGQNKIVVIFSSEETDDTDELIEAMESFGSFWEETDVSHCITDMQIRVEESQMLEMVDFIWKNYPYFLTPADYLRMDSLLSTPGYIANQMESNKTLLMLPTGGMMVRNLQYDPLRLFTPVMQRLQSFNIDDQYQIIDGYIFNRDGNKGLVFLSSPYGISESLLNEKLSVLIDSVILKTEKEYSEVSISAVGAPLIAVINARQIKKDSLLSVSLSIILIFAILIFSFKRFDDLFWIGVSILFGWLFALGCIAAYKDSISIIVLGIGSVIIGIAVNYPLHFLDHLKHEPNKRIALKEMASPLLIGNITTVSAFLCLLFLNAKAIRDLGLFGSLTLVGTILFVLIFLPVLVPKRKVSRNEFQFNLDRFIPLSEESRRKALLPIAVITAILAYFSLEVSFDSDMQHINYMTKQQRADLNLLSTSIQRKDSAQYLYAVSENKDLQKALQQNEDLLKELEYHTGTGKILQISGINNFIPSISRQKETLREWAAFWNVHANSIKDLEEESKRLGFSPQAFSPFLESITASYEPHDAGYFKTIMESIGENYIMKADSVIRIVNYIQVPKKDGAELKEWLNKEIAPTCFVFDTKDVSNQLVSILSDDFNYIGFICGFVVFFFLWVSFGRLELSFLSFLPLAVSWIWILGIMQLLDIQFNIVNIILATFIFGQGDDYTIFITEGLMYEYAYGKKTLASYKNSVGLSAIIMFIGMGMLIFAKHPAMKSLAEVAVIGMLTVVAMAYYLPPLIFKWITTSEGRVRQIPITLNRLGRSLFSLLFFLFGMYLVMIPFTFLYFRIGRTSERKRIRYHKVLQFFSTFIIRHVPGVKFAFDNANGETFEKPAVIICNHQSHLDLMCIMMLTPKLVILTNDRVWNNPFYGIIIKYAEFYPVSNGVDANLVRLQSMIDRGYSVAVFPEGTRSEDCSILRFHQGAFYLSRKLGVDILPVFIHGVGHVLPKKDFMLREGRIYMELGKRMPATEVSKAKNALQLASQFHRIYCDRYKEICISREDAGYFIPYVRHKYMYKGHGVESRCRKTLQYIKTVTGCIDRDYRGAKTVWITNSGQGEFAWLFALVHKDMEVYAFEQDEDCHLLAINTSGIPCNLHFIHLINEEQLRHFPVADKEIDVINITPDV
ncbi:MAG: 1-acyl-sn-glycerol-3-phosphate acyltransferase [Mediterranea sp.]|nr:1-acyl-sn-glycerol-3-phosphate acyltransferase [Mediterranea sp.]